ncbi:MAG: hypothetical protein J7551_07595 [Chloroflexi bacterium]|nr:hypothetical protein [Chloroflexota bacterium]
MNSTSRRVTNVGLLLLGVLVILIALAGVSSAAINPAVGLGMVAAYLALALLLYKRADLGALAAIVQRKQAALSAAARMSDAARRASLNAKLHAKSHPEASLGSELTLLDIGMLVNERRPDGSWDRRIAQESAALDDAFLQPYVKLFAPPGSGERHIALTFEFYDRSGRLQFRHSMEDYLRTGENLILCERQLALRGAEQPMRAGTWDLRVKVDGVLIGLHNFSMASSSGLARSAPSRRSYSAEGDYEEAPPISLEDLLREQARRRNR